MKIAIITSGYLPVPATKGGAVESIVNNIVTENEQYKMLDIVVYSCMDENAKRVSLDFLSTKVVFFGGNWLVERIDKLVYFLSYRILRRKKSVSYRYIFSRISFINKVSKSLSQECFDKIIIENHSSLFWTLKLRNNYRKYAGKYYYHLHNVVTNSFGCYDIIKKSEKIIAVSDYINRELASYLSEENSEKYAVLKNCVVKENFQTDFRRESIIETRLKFGISSCDKVILFTGRIDPDKGVKELLAAFRKIPMMNTKLLIVGSYFFDTNLESEFTHELSELARGLESKIKFTGYVNYSEMPKIYAISDVVVLPSIWNDPAPLTVIEAITSLKPLITTNSGGIPEYAKSGTSIILDRDEKLVENLTNAIVEILTDSKLSENMVNAQKSLSESWTMKNYYHNLLEILK